MQFGKSRCIARTDPETLERTCIADVPMDNPSSPPWIHDLPGTENYIIVPDTPVLYDLKVHIWPWGGTYSGQSAPHASPIALQQSCKEGSIFEEIGQGVNQVGLQAVILGQGDYCVFKWSPEAQKTKFHIVPKAGGPVRTIQAPFDYMTFHYTNAFESQDGREIYMDTSAHSDPQHLNLLKLDNLRNLIEDATSIPGPLS